MRTRTGTGVSCDPSDHPAPHTINSIEAQMRSEEGLIWEQHMRDTNPTAVGLPQPTVYRVWETDTFGRDQCIDVRERLPDGTSRSVVHGRFAAV